MMEKHVNMSCSSTSAGESRASMNVLDIWLRVNAKEIKREATGLFLNPSFLGIDGDVEEELRAPCIDGMTEIDLSSLVNTLVNTNTTATLSNSTNTSSSGRINLGCCHNNSASGTHKKKVLFIEDHVKLWNYLAGFPGHALGKHAPFFEVSLLLLYDRRTAYGLWYLLIYYFLYIIVSLAVTPTIQNAIGEATGLFVWFLLYSQYYSCLKAYKTSVQGSIFAKSFPESYFQEFTTDGAAADTRKNGGNSRFSFSTQHNPLISHKASESHQSTFVTGVNNSSCSTTIGHQGGQTIPAPPPPRAVLAHDDNIQSPIYLYDGKIPYRTLLSLFFKTLGGVLSDACWCTSSTNNVDNINISKSEIDGDASLSMSGDNNNNNNNSSNNNSNANEVELMYTRPTNNSNKVSNVTKTEPNTEPKTENSPVENLSSDDEEGAYRQLLAVGKTARCRYYLLLNVGTRFLENVSGNGGGNRVVQLPFGTIAQKFILVCTVYLAMYALLIVYTFFTAVHLGEQFPSPLSMWIFIVGNLFFLLPGIYAGSCLTGVVVAVVGLWHGSQIMICLATSWVERFSSLRLVNIDSLEAEAKAEAEISGGVVTTTTVNMRGLAIKLQKDAFEHYLILREYATQISEIWSNIILCLLVASVVYVGLIFYEIVVADNILADAIWSVPGAILILLGLFSTFCFAQANGAVDKIAYVLQHSSKCDDFAIIGGRELWLEHIEKSPARWTIHGFALTWYALFAFSSSIGTAIVGIVASFIFALANTN